MEGGPQVISVVIAQPIGSDAVALASLRDASEVRAFLPLLVWAPAATSLILGVVYLFLGDARSAFKILGVFVFLAAVYFQFFSRYVLVGLLLQIALALYLALWHRMGASS